MSRVASTAVESIRAAAEAIADAAPESEFSWLGPKLAARVQIASIYADLAAVAPTVPWPLASNPSPEYVAGLLDGEGHFGINKHIRRRNGRPQYLSRVQIGNTEPSLCDPLLVFGGKNALSRAGRWMPNARACYKWTVHNRQAQTFILAVLPYMRHPAKVHAAKVVLMMEFLRRGRHQGQGYVIDEDRIPVQEALYQKIMRLNARGVRVERDEPEPLFRSAAEALASVTQHVFALSKRGGLDVVGAMMERLDVPTHH